MSVLSSSSTQIPGSMPQSPFTHGLDYVKPQFSHSFNENVSNNQQPLSPTPTRNNSREALKPCEDDQQPNSPDLLMLEPIKKIKLECTQSSVIDLSNSSDDQSKTVNLPLMTIENVFNSPKRENSSNSEDKDTSLSFISSDNSDKNDESLIEILEPNEDDGDFKEYMVVDIPVESYDMTYGEFYQVPISELYTAPHSDYCNGSISEPLVMKDQFSSTVNYPYQYNHAYMRGFWDNMAMGTANPMLNQTAQTQPFLDSQQRLSPYQYYKLYQTMMNSNNMSKKGYVGPKEFNYSMQQQLYQQASQASQMAQASKMSQYAVSAHPKAVYSPAQAQYMNNGRVVNMNSYTDFTPQNMGLQSTGTVFNSGNMNMYQQNLSYYNMATYMYGEGVGAQKDPVDTTELIKEEKLDTKEKRSKQKRKERLEKEKRKNRRNKLVVKKSLEDLSYPLHHKKAERGLNKLQVLRYQHGTFDNSNEELNKMGILQNGLNVISNNSAEHRCQVHGYQRVSGFPPGIENDPEVAEPSNVMHDTERFIQSELQIYLANLRQILEIQSLDEVKALSLLGGNFMNIGHVLALVQGAKAMYKDLLLKKKNT